MMGRFILCARLCLILPAAAAPTLKLGDLPPSFVGRTLDGDKLDLAAYQGKVVVVTFWATWCTPCLNELPVLNAIQKEAGDDHLRVIAVNFKEDRVQFRKVVRALKDWRIAFVYDTGGRAARIFGVKSVPHMFMIGPRGRIAFIHVGYAESALDGIVDELNVLLRAQLDAASSG